MSHAIDAYPKVQTALTQASSHTNTPPDQVAAMAAELVQRQPAWSEAGWKHRQAALAWFHGKLARDADAWIDLIRDEIGKPRIEAETEVVSTLDAVRWTVRRAGKLLGDTSIGPEWQRWMLMKSARIHHRPYGLVGMIGTWNYPLLLNAAPIVQALAAGNTVLWKPSEYATNCGRRLHELLVECELAPNVVSTVYGGPEVGKALIGTPLRKAVFTGGTVAGHKVLADLASRGIPAVAELSGYDAAIIAPGADMDSAVPALAWAAFVGAGQTCVAIKRIYVVGDAAPWAAALGQYANSLSVGRPESGQFDLGPLIAPEARRRFLSQIQQAINAGAQPQAGPSEFSPSDDASSCRPVVLLAGSTVPERFLEGSFGPVVVVRGVPDFESAVAAVNDSEFGLSASLWGPDTRKLAELAPRLEVGMVTINDAVTAAGHMTAPFGGMKASGFGRTRGPAGLAEFVQPQAVHIRGQGGFRPQLYPYQKTAGRLSRLLKIYRSLYHRPGR